MGTERCCIHSGRSLSSHSSVSATVAVNGAHQGAEAVPEYVKERFPDDKLKQNEVLSKLFEDAKMNPLAGCFTSLASLPVFLGLYRSVNALAKTGEID